MQAQGQEETQRAAGEGSCHQGAGLRARPPKQRWVLTVQLALHLGQHQGHGLGGTSGGGHDVQGGGTGAAPACAQQEQRLSVIRPHKGCTQK